MRRFAVVIMTAATLAFTFQGTFIATSEAATGNSSHYHHGFAHSHADNDGEAHSHDVTHVHVDGTIHRHAVDDDDGALDEHLKEHGCPCCWNMAIAVRVLPTGNFCSIAVIAGSKLAIEMASPHRGAEPDGLRRPPRTPSIA
jgi:hypothetical protein